MNVRWRSVRPRIDSLRQAAVATLLAAVLGMSTIAPSVAQEDDADTRPSIVVTTEMLGWLVSELTEDDAEVVVLMRGVDPHAWEPSARDVETMYAADLVVANGSGLEEGIDDALAEAEASRVPVFLATDHIVVREAETEHAEGEDHDEGADHDHAGGDPHFWLDPVAMRDVARALGPALEQAGVPVGDRGEQVAAALEVLDVEVRDIIDDVPFADLKVVSGHESLGYFADRYGLELVGAVVPGLTSQGEVSAGRLAELIETIRREDVPVIFVELGTPTSIAQAVAEETGADVVELPTEQLPADGSYETFIREIATHIADALAR
jgi:zinc/manganese transport system substrate-binding protein